MTQEVARRLHPRNQLTNRADEVVAAFVAGETYSQMAARFGSSIQALTKFRHKHQAQIDALKVELAERVKDVVLTTQEGRIRELAWWYGQIREEAVENGIIVVEERVEGRGEEAVTYKTRDFRGQMVKEARGVIADIAAELGERSSKGGDTFNIDKAILVRYVQGPQ